MECQIFDKLTEKIRMGEKAALATLVKKTGTSPAKLGMMMVVFEDGKTLGTIGGGDMEFRTVKKCLERIESEESGYEVFSSSGCEDKSEKNDYDSSSEIFIRVFIPKNRILIVGCGHVGTNFYNVARTQNFDIALFDDREEFCNRDRFPEGELFLGNVPENLRSYNISEKTYVVVCRHNHEADQKALETLIGRGAAYIGMLGSRKKIKNIKGNLTEKGFSEEELNEIVTPIGIDVGSSAPDELGVGIMAQILIEKNKVSEKQ